MPTFSFRPNADGARLARPDRECARRTAVPTVGCPANGNSRFGVKMRMSARCRESAGGKTNTVSDKLNSPAIACMPFVSRPSASSTTASGLPVRRSAVKTSSVDEAAGHEVRSPQRGSDRSAIRTRPAPPPSGSLASLPQRCVSTNRKPTPRLRPELFAPIPIGRNERRTTPRWHRLRR